MCSRISPSSQTLRLHRQKRTRWANSQHWSTTSWRKVPGSDARSVRGGLHGEISSCKYCSEISSCKYCAAVSCAQWYTRHRILYSIRLETGNLYCYYLPRLAPRHRRFSDSTSRISTFPCLLPGLVGGDSWQWVTQKWP